MPDSTITISHVMSFLAENSIPNLPSEALAEVFDSLIWCLSDNGEGILNVRKDWLSCDDLLKVKIALAMKEVFPYKTKEEMTIHFNKIIQKWPELKSICNKIVSEWDRQFF